MLWRNNRKTSKTQSVSRGRHPLRIELLEERRLLSAVPGVDEPTCVCASSCGGETHCCAETSSAEVLWDEEAFGVEGALCECGTCASENGLGLSAVIPETPILPSESALESALESDVPGTLHPDVLSVDLPITGAVYNYTVHNYEEFTDAILRLYGSVTITFAADYTGSTTYTTNQISLSNSLTLDASALSSQFTINADGGTCFYVFSGASISLKNIHITNAQYGVRNSGTATLFNVSVSNITDTCIANGGTMTLQNVEIYDSSYFGVMNSGTLTASNLLAHDIANTSLNVSGGTATLYHSTFYTPSATSVVYASGGTVSLNNSIVVGISTSFNVFLNHGTLTGSGSIFTSVKVNETNTAVYTLGNPVFTDTANGDYSLKSTSPGFDAITDTTNVRDVYGNLLTTDIYGNERLSGAGYDLGAVEKVISAAKLDTPTGLKIQKDESNPETEFIVTWNSVANASAYQLKYRFEHPECAASDWITKTLELTNVTTQNGVCSYVLGSFIERTTVYVEIQAAGDNISYSNSLLTSSGVHATTQTVNFSHSLALSGGKQIENVFALHSYIPQEGEAVKTIYLDFTGHLTSGTSWNSQSQPYMCTPTFSSSGDSNFSEFESPLDL